MEAVSALKSLRSIAEKDGRGMVTLHKTDVSMLLFNVMQALEHADFAARTDSMAERIQAGLNRSSIPEEFRDDIEAQLMQTFTKRGHAAELWRKVQQELVVKMKEAKARRRQSELRSTRGSGGGGDGGGASGRLSGASSAAGGSGRFGDVAASLVGSGRRNSSFMGVVQDVSARNATRRRRSVASLHIYLDPAHPRTAGVLSSLDDWDFDVFEADTLSGHGALVLTGSVLLAHHDLVARFSIDTEVLHSFLSAVSAAYEGNPYHNAMHGADVCQTMHYFLTRGGMGRFLRQEHVLAALVAALVHDVAHPGRNNAFLIKAEDAIATCYNDQSPLENMHCARAFTIMKDPGKNILGGLKKEKRASIRACIIAMVLATDNSRHMEYLTRLEHVLQIDHNGQAKGSKGGGGSSGGGGGGGGGDGGGGGGGGSAGASPTAGEGAVGPKMDMDDTDNVDLVLSIALHAADVSNPAKQWDLYLSWSKRIATEFYAQGDEEKALGLPISPGCDRAAAVPLHVGQLGFIDFIVLPLYTKFSMVPGVTVGTCVAQLRENRARWEAMLPPKEGARGGGAAGAAGGGGDSAGAGMATIREGDAADEEPRAQ